MRNPATSNEELETDEPPPSGALRRAGHSLVDGVNLWAVFDSAPDAYLVLAPDPSLFTMIAANEARLRLTNTRLEDVVGRPLFEVFPDNPTDPGATGVRNLQASLNEVLRSRKPDQMAIQRYDLRTPDGGFEERYWDPLNSPVFDDNGNLIYITHRVRDVTEQVRESAAHAAETRTRKEIESILESITDAFFTVDREWRFTYVNQRAEEILRRRRGDLIGHSLWQEFPEAVGTTFDREYHRAMTQQTAAEFESCYEPLGIWVDVRAYPTPDALSVYFRDITRRKRAEEALRESEERYRLLADMIPQNIWTTDADGNHTYFSRRWYDFTGASAEESHGEGWMRFIHPDDKERMRERWNHSLATGEPYEIEYRFRGRDGEYRWFLGKAMPLRNDAGKIVEWFGTATDISESKRAEEALRESERNFRALANSIPQLAWMADPSGWIFWYNDRWHEYTGTTPQEMEGWGWQKVHHPDHVERVVERIKHSFETGAPWEDIFPLQSSTGEYRWFLSRAMPIRGSDGEVVRWFGTNTDITAERNAAAERERLLESEREARADAERRREELERVTESRTRLMRGFSHDVKNPLGAADGYAALLEEEIGGELSEAQCRSVQRIRASIQVSLRLINDLLELAKAEAGQIELKMERIDAAALAREVAEDFRGQISAAGLTLQVDAADSVSVQSDPTRVRQILSNLLSNAVKYTRAGSVTVTASRRSNEGAPREGEWVAISVADTGPGIPSDKQQTIFQEFTRLDPNAPHGAGVGLAISRRIARLLGADVTVGSEVGRGSNFTLWLPCT